MAIATRAGGLARAPEAVAHVLRECLDRTHAGSLRYAEAPWGRACSISGP